MSDLLDSSVMLRTPAQLNLYPTPAKPKRAPAHARTSASALLPHVAREAHRKEHPVHVTMRRVAVGPSFRAQRVCAAIRDVITDAKENGVRVLHYSVQDNHLHLMVEGSSSADLSNQMRTLFSRIAFAVNAVAPPWEAVSRSPSSPRPDDASRSAQRAGLHPLQ